MDSAQSLKFKSRAMQKKYSVVIFCKFSVHIGIALKPSSLVGGWGEGEKKDLACFNLSLLTCLSWKTLTLGNWVVLVVNGLKAV